MILCGYLYFRIVDSIRYPIYKSDDNVFFVYKDKSYKINIPDEFKNEFVHITLNNQFNYADYEREIKETKYPKVIDINDKKIVNNGYVTDLP